jgi:hypothetical protein
LHGVPYLANNGLRKGKSSRGLPAGKGRSGLHRLNAVLAASNISKLELETLPKIRWQERNRNQTPRTIGGWIGTCQTHLHLAGSNSN